MGLDELPRRERDKSVQEREMRGRVTRDRQTYERESRASSREAALHQWQLGIKFVYEAQRHVCEEAVDLHLPRHEPLGHALLLCDSLVVK